jgi:hypothetical protein
MDFPTQKKPTWRNTLKYSSTSAYSLTSPLAQPACSLPSHPATSINSRAKAQFRIGTSRPAQSIIPHPKSQQQAPAEIGRRFM